MPFALEVSTPWAVGTLTVFLLIGFAIGRTGKKTETKVVKVQPDLPSKADLEEMRDTFHEWLELGEKVGGWKAAVYGAVGVIIGAAGGLAADWVTNGDMSLAQIGRALLVLVGALLLTMAVIVFVQIFKPIEWVIKLGERISKRQPPTRDPKT